MFPLFTILLVLEQCLMSLPAYLNTILHSQIKNKQIEQIQNEIKQILPPEVRASLNNRKTNSVIDIKTNGATTQPNFFNHKSRQDRQSQTALFAGKTFSQMNVLRSNKNQAETDKQKIQIKKKIEDLEQSQKMVEWRRQMIRNLKQSKATKSVLKEEKMSAERQIHGKRVKKSFTAEKLPQKSDYRLLSKIVSTDTQSPAERTPINHKNIILIRPSSIKDEETLQKMKKVPKIKKSLIFQKLNAQKQQNSDMFMQHLSNFNALIPYIGLQKVKVENRQLQRKSYQASLPQLRKRERRGIVGDQLMGRICGWQIGGENADWT